MSSFDDELRGCLAELLRASVPPAAGDAVTFYGQWLAERNLGLVPILDATAFSWPGMWLARVRTSDDDVHAVVMFGSPSGPLFDPAQAFADSATIEAGWLVAPLDLELPTERPYGDDAGAGSVAALLVAREAESPLVRVDDAVAVAGRGLEGDRYAAGRGTFGRSGGRGYELTLVEAEVLDELGLPWEQARRNVVTRGVSLNPLVGRRFRIGAVECVGRRLAEPCSHLERLSGRTHLEQGLLRPLVHRAGLRADIVSGGPLRVGDELVPA
jgi:MOSC domain-containing protein